MSKHAQITAASPVNPNGSQRLTVPLLTFACICDEWTGAVSFDRGPLEIGAHEFREWCAVQAAREDAIATPPLFLFDSTVSGEAARFLIHHRW